MFFLGDAAGAAIITSTPPGESSRLEKFRMETFGSLKDLATIQGGGSKYHPFDSNTQPHHNLFKMEGNDLLVWAADHVPEFLEKLEPGLSKGL